MDRPPPYDSTATALGQLEERQGIPGYGRSRAKGSDAGLGAAGLQPAHPWGTWGHGRAGNPPWLCPVSGLCEGAGGGAVTVLPSCHPGPGCHGASRLPAGPEVLPDGSDTVQGLPEGTRRPLPRSRAGRELSDTAGFPEVRGGSIPGSAVSAHASFPARAVTLACEDFSASGVG